MIPGFATVLAASAIDRRDLFIGAGNRLGTVQQNIEKDFWVCWTLDAFFNGLAAGGPRLLCLLLNISLPGLNGLELQKRVAVERTDLPIIFITGYGDVPKCVQAMKVHELRNRHSSLTPREREVMALVVSGLLNKQVAGELGISEITVKAHRGQVMQKMKANSVADLVRVAGKLHDDAATARSGTVASKAGAHIAIN